MSTGLEKNPRQFSEIEGKKSPVRTGLPSGKWSQLNEEVVCLMPRKGENIYKRKDGRWEGRYIQGRTPSGKAKYGFVYGKTYREAKAKLLEAAAIKQNGNLSDSDSHLDSFTAVAQE